MYELSLSFASDCTLLLTLLLILMCYSQQPPPHLPLLPPPPLLRCPGFSIMLFLAALTALSTTVLSHGPPGFGFGSMSNPTLFADGMILQRGGAKVWGSGNSGTVTLKVSKETGETIATTISSTISIGDGNATTWMAVLTAPATASAMVTATDSSTGKSISLHNVAFGDVILCGGQVSTPSSFWHYARAVIVRCFIFARRSLRLCAR